MQMSSFPRKEVRAFRRERGPKGAEKTPPVTSQPVDCRLSAFDRSSPFKTVTGGDMEKNLSLKKKEGEREVQTGMPKDREKKGVKKEKEKGEPFVEKSGALPPV